MATFAVLLSLASPVFAQEVETETDQGLSLMEEGARLIMRGLMSEMAPAIDGLRGSVEQMGPAMGEFVREMGPGFASVLNRVDDIRHYTAPEFLPNGDIILRRKPDAPLWSPEPDTDSGGSGEVEL